MDNYADYTKNISGKRQFDMDIQKHATGDLPHCEDVRSERRKK
jgi:hypothetical protein